jgi:hypothetical protein
LQQVRCLNYLLHPYIQSSVDSGLLAVDKLIILKNNSH